MKVTSETIDRLREIREEMQALLGEAQELVHGTSEQARAESYWIAHIEGALDKGSSRYLGGSMIDMTETIDALAENVDDDDDDEE